ncbi:unnamed protein product [Eretmochelys imbricata]
MPKRLRGGETSPPPLARKPGSSRAAAASWGPAPPHPGQCQGWSRSRRAPPGRQTRRSSGRRDHMGQIAPSCRLAPPRSRPLLSAGRGEPPPSSGAGRALCPGPPRRACPLQRGWVCRGGGSSPEVPHSAEVSGSFA